MVLKIPLDPFCQERWHRSLVRPLFLHVCGRKNYPPRVLDADKGATELERTEVLEPDWTRREECNHQSVTEPCGAGERRRLRYRIRFRHQGEPRFNQDLRVHQPIKLRAGLHDQSKIILDVNEPGQIEGRRDKLSQAPDLADRAIDGNGAQAFLYLRQIDLDIGGSGMGSRLRRGVQPAVSAQAVEQVAVSSLQIVSRYGLEVTCRATAPERLAGPAGCSPRG